MSENSEQLKNSPEQSVETHQPIENHIEKADRQQESTPELSPRDLELKAERAKIEALETAISVEVGGKEKDKVSNSSASIRRGPIGKKQQNESFTHTMSHIQNELSVGSRTFSKIIHNKAVEGATNALGNTIARPNAILAGAIVAFILTLLTYVVAKTIGYALSGFETIAAFIIGWLIGILYDYFKVMFTGKKI